MIYNLQLLRKKGVLNSSDWEDFLPLVDNGKTKVGNRVPLIEKVLISKINKGDSSAFSCVFSVYYKDLVIFACRFTNEINSSEEIVQDIFVRLWEEHESVNITISLKSYLLIAVRNRCIDWIRHKKILQKHNDFVLENSPRLEFDADSYILYSELQEQIEAALARLPEAISATFRMNRNKGLKYSEIAELMDVSVRTVEVRIGKALHLLRNYLKEYFIVVIGVSGILFTNWQL
jgi:RNA polymerase sigma-70 factor (family 1)